MAIGNAKTMIDKGAWQTNPQPKLEKSYKMYKPIFRFVFKYKGFTFLCEYLVDKEESNKSCFFIRPKYSEIKPNTIVFSDEIKISKYWQRDIYNVSFDNDKLKKFFMTFKENCIFYSDDLTGTDFKQCIDFLIRK